MQLAKLIVALCVTPLFLIDYVNASEAFDHSVISILGAGKSPQDTFISLPGRPSLQTLRDGSSAGGTYTITSLPSNGTLTAPFAGPCVEETSSPLPDGSSCTIESSSPVIYYRPNEGFLGEDSFTWRYFNFPDGSSREATVSISIADNFRLQVRERDGGEEPQGRLPAAQVSLDGQNEYSFNPSTTRAFFIQHGVLSGDGSTFCATIRDFISKNTTFHIKCYREQLGASGGSWSQLGDDVLVSDRVDPTEGVGTNLGIDGIGYAEAFPTTISYDGNTIVALGAFNYEYQEKKLAASVYQFKNGVWERKGAAFILDSQPEYLSGMKSHSAIDHSGDSIALYSRPVNNEAGRDYSLYVYDFVDDSWRARGDSVYLPFEKSSTNHSEIHLVEQGRTLATPSGAVTWVDGRWDDLELPGGPGGLLTSDGLNYLINGDLYTKTSDFVSDDYIWVKLSSASNDLEVLTTSLMSKDGGSQWVSQDGRILAPFKQYASGVYFGVHQLAELNYDATEAAGSLQWRGTNTVDNPNNAYFQSPYIPPGWGGISDDGSVMVFPDFRALYRCTETEICGSEGEGTNSFLVYKNLDLAAEYSQTIESDDTIHLVSGQELPEFRFEFLEVEQGDWTYYQIPGCVNPLNRPPEALHPSFGGLLAPRNNLDCLRGTAEDLRMWFEMDAYRNSKCQLDYNFSNDVPTGDVCYGFVISGTAPSVSQDTVFSYELIGGLDRRVCNVPTSIQGALCTIWAGGPDGEIAERDFLDWNFKVLADSDTDGYPDSCDEACLEDGHKIDAFPDDPNESEDTDGDGVGNNADTDDDGDGYSDFAEVTAGTDPLSSESFPSEDEEGSGGLPIWMLYIATQPKAA